MRVEPCPSCRGSGLQNGMYGIEDCYACNGQCEVASRDERGRFLPPRTDNVDSPT